MIGAGACATEDRDAVEIALQLDAVPMHRRRHVQCVDDGDADRHRARDDDRWTGVTAGIGRWINAILLQRERVVRSRCRRPDATLRAGPRAVS